MARTQDVGRLSISMVANTVEYVNKLKQAENVTKARLDAIEKKFKETAAESKRSSKKVNTLSNRLKEMSQTASLATGPLGGVAARLSVLSTVVSGGALAAGVVGITTAITGMFLALRNGIQVYDKTILQLDQLEATITKTGYAAGVTSGQIDSFARKLALDTLTSTEEARKAMGKLATFTNITGDAFFRATKISQNLSQAGFSSLTETITQFGKALSDPIKGMTSLTDSGVSFSEPQRKMIENLIKQNRLFEAQALILDIVESQLGDVGVAQAANTITGALDTTIERWNSLTEIMAKPLHPGVLDGINNLNTALHTIAKFLDENYEFRLEAPDLAKTKFDKIPNEEESLESLTKQIEERERLVTVLKTQVEQAKELVDAEFGATDIYPLIPTALIDASITTDLEESLALQERQLITQNAELEALKAKRGLIKNTLNIQKDGTSKATTEKQSELEKKVEALRKASAALKKQRMADDAKEAKERLSLLVKQLQEEAAARKKSEQDILDATLLAAEIKWGEEVKFINKYIKDADFKPIDLEFMIPDVRDELKKKAEGLAIQETIAKTQGIDQNALDALNEQYNAEKALLESKTAQELIDKETLNAAKLALDEQYLQDKHELENKKKMDDAEKTRETWQKNIDLVQSGLGGISDAYDKSGKENEKAQKAIFLAQQAAAFAMNIVNTNANMSKKGISEPEYYAELAAGISRGATIAATTIGGVAHGGLDSVPSESTFLLQKGERVVQPKANKDLTTFLSRKQNDTGNVSVSAPMTIQGNVTDQKWFQQELYKHRQLISSSINKAKREKPRRG